MGQAAAGLSVRQGRANVPLLEDVQKPEARKAFEAESNDFDRPKRAWRNQLAEHWGADVELARAANDGSNVDTVSPTVLSVSTCRPGGYLCTTLPNYFPPVGGLLPCFRPGETQSRRGTHSSEGVHSANPEECGAGVTHPRTPPTRCAFR